MNQMLAIPPHISCELEDYNQWELLLEWVEKVNRHLADHDHGQSEIFFPVGDLGSILRRFLEDIFKNAGWGCYRKHSEEHGTELVLYRQFYVNRCLVTWVDRKFVNAEGVYSNMPRGSYLDINGQSYQLYGFERRRDGDILEVKEILIDDKYHNANLTVEILRRDGAVIKKRKPESDAI